MYYCRLFVQLQIIYMIADYLCDCRFLDLVLFLPRNLQDLWRIGGFLEDLWIICTIVDNFYDCRLLEQLQIIGAIADCSCICGLFAQFHRYLAGLKVHVQARIYVDFLAKSRISLAFILECKHTYNGEVDILELT